MLFPLKCNTFLFARSVAVLGPFLERKTESAASIIGGKPYTSQSLLFWCSLELVVSRNVNGEVP